ncbi:glycoside hydrolase family 19 protein [Paraburkholderia sp. BR10872]|uniref:glycoside hydrolase family 19 protein n=1 Tax=Paraburkholderia sp. BR10872 TaxID=3236989 RepID=UPI0034D33E16
MELTASIVSAGCGAPIARAMQWLAPIQSACNAYQIDTPLRVAAFLAEIGVESGRLVFTAELWGPTLAQQEYDPPSVKAKGLGNTDPGDGFKYRGRGLIQITGKANYAICGLALNLPLIDHPELLQQPDNAALSAAWFWSNNKLNQWADAGNFLAVSRAINLGNPHSTGTPLQYSQRLALYGAAKKALGLANSLQQ